MAAAFIAGIASACLRRLLPRFRVEISFSPCCGCRSERSRGRFSLCGSGQTHRRSLFLTAYGIVLVPGVPLINGIREISSGNAGNGVTPDDGNDDGYLAWLRSMRLAP